MLMQQATAIAQRAKLTVPDGTDVERARRYVAEEILRKLVAQAVDAGVAPDYQAWLQMGELERAMWVQAHIERQQQYWALLSAAVGNPAMARMALHLEDKDAQVDDAIEAGLRKAGLL